jgi:hypothetical protein
MNMLDGYLCFRDGSRGKEFPMAQKADQQLNQDYYDTYNRSDSQGRWIWGSIAALALLAGIVWFATSSNMTTAPAPSASTATEEPAPVAPPAAPAAEEPAPATGNQSTPPQQ